MLVKELMSKHSGLARTLNDVSRVTLYSEFWNDLYSCPNVIELLSTPRGMFSCMDQPQAIASMVKKEIGDQRESRI